MERVVPWQALLKLLMSYDGAREHQGEGPAYSLETLLRVHLVQSWWGLSDEDMEDHIIDRISIRRFNGVDLAKRNSPDVATIMAFRQFLETHQLGEKIQEQVEEALSEVQNARPAADL